MKTVVNYRFLIIFVISVVLRGVAVHGLHAYQVSRQGRFLLDEARRAKQERQFERAVNYYLQYTKLSPQDNDAQAELGKLLADVGSFRAAVFTLEKVLRDQPDRVDLRRQVVQLDLRLARYSDAQFHLDKLIKAAPNDASMLQLQGEYQLLTEQYDKAADSFQKAITISPQQIGAYLDLAAVYRRDPGHTDDADKWMAKMVRDNSSSSPAHAHYGEYLESRGKDKAALEQANASLKLDPKNLDALLLAARQFATADYEKARAFAKQAKDIAPALPRCYLTLADVELRHHDNAAAIKCLEDGVATTAGKDATLMLELGRLQFDSGELGKAQQTVSTLMKLTSDERSPAQAGILQGRIEFANKHWPQAIQQFERVAPLLEKQPDVFKTLQHQIAHCQAQLGNTELQLAADREAARVDPLWPPARMGIAAALVSLGKLDEALEEYRQASKLKGMEAQGNAQVVQLLIIKNLSAAPDQQEEGWREVNSLLAQLGEKDPDAVGLTQLKADALVGQRKFDQADQLLQGARDKAPKNTDLWSFQVNLAVRRGAQGNQNAWDLAAKLLDDAHKQFGDAVWLRLLEASYAVAREPQKSVDQIKAIGARPGSWSDDEKLKLFGGLTILSLRAGAVDLASDFASRASAADPRNLAIRRLLFECAWQRHDISQAQDALKQIKGIEGEGALWHWGQAALCLLVEPADPAQDDEAFLHLVQAGKLRPGWAKVPLLKARILDRQGQIALALPSYLESIELGERDPLAVRRAVELLNSRQRYVEADKILRRLEEQPTLVSNELERLASEVSARLDDLDRARMIATKVAANSKEWSDHAWLGEVEMLIGLRNRAINPEQARQHFAAAEESLRNAVRLKPDAPEPWVALIRFYVATDRKADAEAMIKLAERRLPADASALALAICYENLGNADEALKKYDLALSKSPQDMFAIRRAVDFLILSRKFDVAEARLRPIVSGQTKMKSDDVVWARRALASVLRHSGSYPKIQEALRLVEQNLPATSSGKDGAPEDRLEKALELAMTPSSMQRRQAIQILEDLLPLQTDPTALRVLLSELHQAENNPLQSLKYLRDLVTSHERDASYATYIAQYVARLLERQETAEAELWIPRLERLAPNELSTASVKAEWLVQRNQVDAAIEALRAYEEKPASNAADRAARLSQSAVALEEIAHGPTGADRSAAAGKLFAAAEAAYRKAAEQEPDKSVAIVSFLGRRERFAEAVALIEQVATTAKPEAIAGAAADLVAAGLAKADLQSRLEKVLLDVSQRYGRSISILMTLGDLRTSQDRLVDSAEIYREILKQDPNNVSAMNNLAVLFALQKKDLKEALSLIDRAISLKGPFPALLDSRASVCLALGKPQEALADLDAVVREEPRPNRQLHRALACWRLGQKQDASIALDAARKLGLKVERLNSLERADYQELVANLKP